MSLRYPVRRGAAYFAGLELPFLVSASAVAGAARERGFSQVLVSSREHARFAFDVRQVEGYSEKWNTAFFGIYDGTSPTIQVPQAPTWLFEVQPQIPPPGRAVVAQVVKPVRAGVSVTKPKGSRVVLWIVGVGAVVVAGAALLEPVRGRA